MRASIRLLTAIALIGICGFALARGWGIVHFSLDSAKKRPDITARWAAAPDVASAALRAEVRANINISDAKAANSRREALASILSIKPMSSIDWLSLSGVKFDTDQPVEQVLGSLRLSAITGPNESYVMTERAIIAVSLWEDLPSDLKSRAAIDIGPMIFPRTPAEGEVAARLRAVVSRKPEWVSNELRKALLAAGFAPKEIGKLL